MFRAFSPGLFGFFLAATTLACQWDKCVALGCSFFFLQFFFLFSFFIPHILITFVTLDSDSGVDLVFYLFCFLYIFTTLGLVGVLTMFCSNHTCTALICKFTSSFIIHPTITFEKRYPSRTCRTI